MELELNKTYLIKISGGFAKSNSLPVFAEATPIIQTPKAAYLYGTGTKRTKAQGTCMACGHKLTHPVSVHLGIGPKCGQHYWDWDLVGGYTKENIERLSQLVTTHIMIDNWIPKATIISAEEIDRQLEPPNDHPKKKGAKPEQKKSAILKENGKTIQIYFPFDYEVLGKVKTLSQRRFLKQPTAHWTCPFSKESIELLEEWGFELSTELKNLYDQKFGAVVETQTGEFEVPGLQMKLYPYQKQGVAFLDKRGGNAIVGDEMGLGKTAQALAYLQLHPEKRPAVVVCPASLKLNWAKECKMWLSNPDFAVLSGRNPYPVDNEILIINYDVLDVWADCLNPSVLIADECHYFKNNKAKRTKAVKKLKKKSDHFIPLSGTPIVNRPIEFYNALNMVEPGLFPSFWKYAQKYCGATHNGFGWDFSGATNTEELNTLIQSIMIRRKKEDVLKDLPVKARSIVPLELSKKDRQEYDSAANNIIRWIRENEGKDQAEKAKQAEVLVSINKLKQIAVKGKIKSCIDWIKNFIEVDGKLVVFADNHWVIDKLMEEFKDVAVKLDGRDDQTTRNEAVKLFQNSDQCRLFVGNMKAAGVGITLTASSNTCFIQFGWTPGDHQQAEDRVHRIGQEADSVNAYYLIAPETIEEDIAQLIDKKAKVLDAVLDGKESDQSSLLSELLVKILEG